MSYLVDSNVVSEARRPNGDRSVKTWIASVPGDDLFLSALVPGEVRRWIERLRQRDSQQAAVYELWLTTLLREYGNHVLPVTVEIAEEWGRMNVPDPVPVVDGLMAATAKVHGMTFVTRNTRDVAGTGVRLLNPFEPPH